MPLGNVHRVFFVHWIFVNQVLFRQIIPNFVTRDREYFELVGVIMLRENVLDVMLAERERSLVLDSTCFANEDPVVNDKVRHFVFHAVHTVQVEGLFQNVLLEEGFEVWVLLLRRVFQHLRTDYGLGEDDGHRLHVDALHWLRLIRRSFLLGLCLRLPLDFLDVRALRRLNVSHGGLLLGWLSARLDDGILRRRRLLERLGVGLIQ